VALAALYATVREQAASAHPPPHLRDGCVLCLRQRVCPVLISPSGLADTTQIRTVLAAVQEQILANNLLNAGASPFLVGLFMLHRAVTDPSCACAGMM